MRSSIFLSNALDSSRAHCHFPSWLWSFSWSYCGYLLKQVWSCFSPTQKPQGLPVLSQHPVFMSAEQESHCIVTTYSKICFLAGWDAIDFLVEGTRLHPYLYLQSLGRHLASRKCAVMWTLLPSDLHFLLYKCRYSSLPLTCLGGTFFYKGRNPLTLRRGVI